MRKYYLILLALLITIMSYAQMGVGTTFPDESAQLDVVSNDKGILIPRVTLQNSTDTTTISSDLLSNPISLLVYNTKASGDLIEGYHYWNGSKWLRLINSDDSNGVVTTLVDNNDGTFTYTSENNTQTTFDADGDLIDNNNGTFTYTNAANTVTTFDAKLTSVIDNSDGTYTITDDFGISITIGGATETTTTLVDNNDGTFTYTSEDNTQTTLTSGSLTNNGDGSYTFTDATGINTTILASTGLAIEPWNGVDDNGPATDNTEDIYTLGDVGIGTNTPSATLEVNGNVIIGNGGTAIRRSLSTTAVLDFPDRRVINQPELTITLAGANIGDVLCLGVPPAAMITFAYYIAWVSSPNVITIKQRNSSYNPSDSDAPPATFRVTVFQY
ncbi:hypothetical protein SAMN05428642_102361 [Flaviramulus basaltis]|uniref:Uncharacterized protein n=1 Tax=Flaviramulus basaltis TaxID=369401 RepID=A0A1K2IHQ0_9FLAO|nr:hypothetical protein [Flaviramulus basaltis]SFZ91822.1 hypothetical protein SAMN05428642_102361 [Flaviramulus basaltis]